MNSRLLLAEKPLVILPNLATLIGLNEAIILQQIHYWLNEKRTNPKRYPTSFVDGQWWVYNTLAEWHEQFPFWSVMTIRRALESLIRQGLLKAETLAEDRRDRTKWYTLNYEELEKLEGVQVAPPLEEAEDDVTKRAHGSVQNEQIRSVQNEHMKPHKMNKSYKVSETSSENTQKILQTRESQATRVATATGRTQPMGKSFSSFSFSGKDKAPKAHITKPEVKFWPLPYWPGFNELPCEEKERWKKEAAKACKVHKIEIRNDAMGDRVLVSYARRLFSEATTAKNNKRE